MAGLAELSSDSLFGFIYSGLSRILFMANTLFDGCPARQSGVRRWLTARLSLVGLRGSMVYMAGLIWFVIVAYQFVISRLA